MTRPIIAKAAALAWGAAICGLSASAAKAIEIDPYPGDGKCYFIENNQTIDYNNGAYSKSLLEENPWYGHQSTSEIAATQFWEKTGQTWRFAWKATSGNTDNGQTDALNTWYYARDRVRPNNPNSSTGYYNNEENVSTFAEGFEFAVIAMPWQRYFRQHRGRWTDQQNQRCRQKTNWKTFKRAGLSPKCCDGRRSCHPGLCQRPCGHHPGAPTNTPIPKACDRGRDH